MGHLPVAVLRPISPTCGHKEPAFQAGFLFVVQFWCNLVQMIFTGS